jgi:hypothetical protein
MNMKIEHKKSGIEVVALFIVPGEVKAGGDEHPGVVAGGPDNPISAPKTGSANRYSQAGAS